jgi:hypothetical protein
MANAITFFIEALAVKRLQRQIHYQIKIAKHQ